MQNKPLKPDLAQMNITMAKIGIKVIMKFIGKSASISKSFPTQYLYSEPTIITKTNFC